MNSFDCVPVQARDEYADFPISCPPSPHSSPGHLSGLFTANLLGISGHPVCGHQGDLCHLVGPCLWPWRRCRTIVWNSWVYSWWLLVQLGYGWPAEPLQRIFLQRVHSPRWPGLVPYWVGSWPGNRSVWPSNTWGVSHLPIHGKFPRYFLFALRHLFCRLT